MRAVCSLYDQSQSLARIAGSKSNSFSVRVGLYEGCPLSPILFLTFLNIISRRSQSVEGIRFLPFSHSHIICHKPRYLTCIPEFVCGLFLTAAFYKLNRSYVFLPFLCMGYIPGMLGYTVSDKCSSFTSGGSVSYYFACINGIWIQISTFLTYLVFSLSA